MIRNLSVLAVSGLLFLGGAAWAADEHHPAGDSAVPSTTTTGPTPQMPMAGMMTGSDSTAMMSMMNMLMNMMSQDMGEMAMPGMGMIDHIEGRLAFLRAELKITDTQTQAWNEFAQALRNNAKRLSELRAAMVPGDANAKPPTLGRRLEQQENWYAARLDGVRATKVTLEHLYGALSDEQKKTADELMGPHLGLMPMGMASMGMPPMGMMSMPGGSQ